MNKPTFKVSDGLTNIYSGVNTGKDQRFYRKWEYSNFNSFADLDVTFRESAMARKAVTIPAEDATRQWRTFTCEDSEKLAKFETFYQLPNFYTELITLSRLSGGALMLLVIEGDDLKEPLDIKNIKKNSLSRLICFDRYEVSGSKQETTDILSENFLLPEYYLINDGMQLIHHSRFLRLNGDWLPRRLNRVQNGWGDPILRSVLDDLNDATDAKTAASVLIGKANIDIFSISGLADALSSGQDQNIQKALEAYKLGLSNTNVALVDGDSNFSRHGLSVGGLDNVIKELRNWFSASCSIPQRRFWGDVATGLGDSDSDLKQYYDDIKSKQIALYTKPLKKFDMVLCKSVLGFIPDDLAWEWNPLYQASETEQAQTNYWNAQADELRIQQGLNPSIVMKKLQTTDQYAITDDHIAEIEKDEEDLKDGSDIEQQITNAINEYKERTQT